MSPPGSRNPNALEQTAYQHPGKIYGRYFVNILTASNKTTLRLS
jgi:hypothetical protein